jgi:hypothetical protein
MDRQRQFRWERQQGGNKVETWEKEADGMKKWIRYVSTICGFTLGVWCLQAAAGDIWSTLRNDAQGYVVAYPSGWKVSLSEDTNVIGIYKLSRLSYDVFKSDAMEMRVYTLGNPDKKPVNGFLTSGKLKSKEFIKQTETSITGMDAVLHGYEYSPPQYGIIKYEVEMIGFVYPLSRNCAVEA